jgi:hypothetical protein
MERPFKKFLAGGGEGAGSSVMKLTKQGAAARILITPKCKQAADEAGKLPSGTRASRVE